MSQEGARSEVRMADFSGSQHGVGDGSRRRAATILSLPCDGCGTMVAFRPDPGVVGVVGTCEDCGRMFHLAGGRLTHTDPPGLTGPFLRHVS